MSDDANLSAEQTDQLICFQEITQIESIEECKQILEAFSWNVESAVQNSFNEKDQQARSLLASQSSSQSSLNSMHANTSSSLHDFHEQTHAHFTEANQHNMPRPSSPRPVRSPQGLALPNVNVFTQRTLSYHGPNEGTVVPQGLFQWSMFIVAFPFKLIFSTLLEIASAFWVFFEATPIPVDYDPLANIAEFAIQYNTNFGTNHVDFYQGSYSQAVNEAKRDLKFLVVYIHQNNNADCTTFATETMTNPDLIEYLRNNCIFWACSKDLPEGQKVFNALRAKRSPFLGVIVCKSVRMTLVSKIEGPVAAPELLIQLAQLFAENEAELVVARKDKEERNETQLIRQQQDQAYEESLKADREKARLKKEKEEARLNAEKLEKERIAAEIARETEVVNRRQTLRNQLAEIGEPDANNPESIKVLIKLPTGSRHQRIFLKNEPVKNLYNFVFSHEECPNNFEIAINFPHKVVECTEESEQTIEDAGINQSMLLFVNDLDA